MAELNHLKIKIAYFKIYEEDLDQNFIHFNVDCNYDAPVFGRLHPTTGLMYLPVYLTSSYSSYGLSENVGKSFILSSDTTKYAFA